MSNKKSVLIMFGGRSSEHEVSLSSAFSVLSNINSENYDIHTVGITKDGKWLYYSGPIDRIKDNTWQNELVYPACLIPDYGSKTLRVFRTPSANDILIDVVFPVMHGANSEDGTLQGLFEICGVPYVGPACLASAVCMDKVFTKLVLNNYNIPQAEYIHFYKSDIFDDADKCVIEAESKFTYPMFVKPANAGSSVGTGKARTSDELKAALINASKHDSKVIIEEYIVGKEIEVAVMGNGTELKVSTPGEIDPGSDYYDYDTKYKSNTSRAHIPARIPKDIAEKIREFAKKIYIYLGCKGLSRIDFFACDNGRIVFNEINTIPGFTNISMYPKMFINDGMSYSEIIDNLINLAIQSEK